MSVKGKDAVSGYISTLDTLFQFPLFSLIRFCALYLYISISLYYFSWTLLCKTFRQYVLNEYPGYR